MLSDFSLLLLNHEVGLDVCWGNHMGAMRDERGAQWIISERKWGKRGYPMWCLSHFIRHGLPTYSLCTLNGIYGLFSVSIILFLVKLNTKSQLQNDMDYYISIVINGSNLLPNFIVLDSTTDRNPSSTPDRMGVRTARAVKDHEDFWPRIWVDCLKQRWSLPLTADLCPH